MQGGIPTLQFSHECRDAAECSKEWIMSHPDEGPFSIKFVANCQAPLQITSDCDAFITICLMDEEFWKGGGGGRGLMQKLEDFWLYTVPSRHCENCPQNQGTCENPHCTKGCPHLALQFQGKKEVMIPGVHIQGGNRTLDDLEITKIGVSDPKKQKPGKKLMRLVALVNVDVNTNNNNIIVNNNINYNNISPQEYLIWIGQTNTFKVMSNKWVRQLRAKEAQQFANERKQISSNTIQMQQPNLGVQHFDQHNWLQRQYNISSSPLQQQQQQQSQQQQQQYLLNQGVDNNTNFGIQWNLILLQQQVQQVLLQIQQLNQRQQQSEQILLQIQQQIQRLQQDEQNNNNNNWDMNLNEQDSISDVPLML